MLSPCRMSTAIPFRQPFHKPHGYWSVRGVEMDSQNANSILFEANVGSQPAERKRHKPERSFRVQTILSAKYRVTRAKMTSKWPSWNSARTLCVTFERREFDHYAGRWLTNCHCSHSTRYFNVYCCSLHTIRQTVPAVLFHSVKAGLYGQTVDWLH